METSLCRVSVTATRRDAISVSLQTVTPAAAMILCWCQECAVWEWPSIARTTQTRLRKADPVQQSRGRIFSLPSWSLTALISHYFQLDISSPEGKVVKLLRYNDVELGPRHIPNCERPDDGLSVIDLTASFSINLELQKVTLHENGRPTEVGSQLVYRVVWKRLSNWTVKCFSIHMSISKTKIDSVNTIYSRFSKANEHL